MESPNFHTESSVLFLAVIERGGGVFGGDDGLEAGFEGPVDGEFLRGHCRCLLDPADHSPIEPCAVESQIDVEARPGGALGQRFEKDGSPDLRVTSQHVLELFHRPPTQSVPVHDSTPATGHNTSSIASLARNTA